MALTWLREPAAHWDADKQRIVGGAPEGTFAPSWRQLAPGALAPGQWWRVASEGKTVGYGWLDVVWGDAEILIATDPASRGHGVGTFIVDRLIAEASAQGLNHVYNVVRPEHPDAERLTAWLRKRGFRGSAGGQLLLATRGTRAAEQPGGLRHRRPGVSGTEFVAWAHAWPKETVDNATYLTRCRWAVSDAAGLERESRMKTRLWCLPNENTWTMAREAVEKLLRADPALKETIDVVVVASGTTMPVLHAPEPGNIGVADLAPLVLRELKRNDALGLDVKACYCTGFLRGVQVMDGLLTTGEYRAGLVIATEQGSRFSIAETNRSGFCFIMGDAAGAAVMRPRAGPGRGLMDQVGFTDASKHSWVGVGPDAASTVMRGGDAGPATLEMLVRTGRELMKRAGLTPASIDWLVPIQTHAALIDALCDGLQWPREKLVWRGDVTGFSGSSSIPAAISDQLERGVIRRGQSVLSLAVGAGLNCAGALFEC